MLIIRDAQLEVFRRRDLDRMVADLAEHLRASFPEQVAALGDDGELRAFCGRTLANAAAHGLDTKGALVVLGELWLQFGEDLRRSPLREWTLNILAAPRLPGELKAETIRDRYRALTGGRGVAVTTAASASATGTGQ